MSDVLKLRMAMLAAFVVPVSLAIASPAIAGSIYDAMAKAYENNPDLNAARAGLRATDEGVTIAKAGWRPQVSGFAQKTTNHFDRNLQGVTTDAFGREIDDKQGFNSFQAGITVTQQIFDGFQTLNDVRAAESNVYSERASLKATEIQILLSAAQSYSNIARDEQIVSIRKQNMAFLREQVKAANARLDVGEGTKTDVSLSQAELAAAEALLASAVFQLKQSQAVFVQIVGEAPRGVKQAKPISNQVPKSVDSAVATGYREHPSIIATMYAIDAAGFQVKSAEGAMLPGVVIQGQLTNNQGNSPFTSLNDYSSSTLTARLNVPIYQGGAEYGQIRQAKERLGQQRIMLDSARLEVQRTIVSAMAQYEAAQAMISANLVQLQASNDALAGVIEEQKVGQATTLDVLDSQAKVLQAEESLAQSRRDAVVASFAIVAAMGHLTIDTMNLKVAKYQPETNYEAVKDAWIGLRTVDGR
ncbi:TolC family outer membrane protein [Rhizobium sp. KVB221]|uniref:TolC family outer membrane protein n=1 Tax=Rhizobium setariae TaxID=2801340 RepID=A0A936YLU7_9HYPH|nr:TolC family outer membrane protein [Rhizobium setariae]MBL0372869.1 TolC family outer membrane protein [Rhizobium setariae]